MKSKTVLHFIAYFFTFLCICSFTSARAYADCENLENNSRWKKYYAQLQEQIKNNQYEQALATSKKLYGICMEHPMLYLSTGIAVENNGEEARAKKYFNKAAELAAQYPISTEDARKIWFKLYEVEHPNSIPEVVEEKNIILNTIVDEITAQKEENEKLTNLLITTGGTDIIEKYEKLMWAGTGVGAGGVLMTLIGGILIGVSPKLNPEPPDRNSEIYINGSYLAGYTLLGMGLGLALSGAGLAGYAGYYITHADDAPSNNPSTEPENERIPITFNFDIGFGNAGLSLNF